MIRHFFIICCIALLVLPNALHANPIVTDLAVRSVDIDHNFDGLDILMFGAQNGAGRIVVSLKGPKKDYIVRKKERVLGIWTNRKSVRFENVDSFYSIASTHPLQEIHSDNLLENFELGIDNLDIRPSFENLKDDDEKTIEEFRQALINAKVSSGLYHDKIEKITFWGSTLFRTTLAFPKNISRGWYSAESYLFSDGVLSAVQSTPIHVSKIGMAAYIYDSAHNHALFYGIFCVLMALVTGWAANALFGRI